MNTATNVETVKVQPIGGSTAILETGGLRLITDPTFDEPGTHGEGMPRRATRPALEIDELGPLDLALVSHDEHPDNLDKAGRALLSDVPLVLTTVDGAARLGGSARGLAPYQHVDVDRPGGGSLRITGLPAQHGPDGPETESVMGSVVGFLLSGDGVPTVYVSGDNASLEVVREIQSRVGEVDVALLFAGAGSIAQLFEGAHLTLSSADAAEAARILGARAVVPIHCDGWSHYSEGTSALVSAFAAASLEHVLTVLPDGEAREF